MNVNPINDQQQNAPGNDDRNDQITVVTAGIESNATKSGIVESDPVKSDPAESVAAESKVIESDSVESDTAESKVIEIHAGETLWRFDHAFMTSNWTCIWGRGCHGIGAEKAAELNQGCCSVGAELDPNADDALNLSASAAALRKERFQFFDEAKSGGIYANLERSNTRVVDGACIFLNRPGFAGGEGCALHIAAVAAGDSPIDWKPSVCWQLPIRVDWEMRDDDVEVATVRAWSRADWGDDGDPMAWCCTERSGPRANPQATDEAYVGERPVFESLAEEIEGIVGTPVYLQLKSRLHPGGGGS